MGQAELARRAVVRRDAIADLESGGRTLLPDNLTAIEADENGEGPGVRLRKKRAL
jgi:hypothetical protein